MREDCERFGQFLARELFGRSTYFDGLRHRDAEICPLVHEALRSQFICFRRVNEVEAENVFLRTRAHVKTVAVIRRVQNETAIPQYNPVFKSFVCANIDRRDPNCSKNNHHDCAAGCDNSRYRELTYGKPAPHQNYGLSSRAKCAAYVAMSAPRTLPA